MVESWPIVQTLKMPFWSRKIPEDQLAREWGILMRFGLRHLAGPYLCWYARHRIRSTLSLIIWQMGPLTNTAKLSPKQYGILCTLQDGSAYHVQ